MNFKESETYKNLQKAFEGEAKAHLKYQFYKSQLANVSKDLENKLDEIVHNEKEHGKIWFKLLHNGFIPEDEINLQDAIEGELYEFSEMYPDFAEVAFDEGFNKIGELFLQVATIEKKHADEFSNILNNIDNTTIFSNIEKCDWKCLNCGHVIYDTESAPNECPVCQHPKKYFVKLSD